MDLWEIRPAVLLLFLCGLSVSGENILPKTLLDALVGTSATFKTLLENPEFMVMSWSYNDGKDINPISTLTTTLQNVDPKYTGRANIDANGTLQLDGVTEAESGEYIFSIIDTAGKTRNGERNLRVIVPATDVVITPNVPEARELITNVDLICSAKGTFLTFKWFNGTTPITGDGTRVTVKDAETEDIKGPTFSTLSISSVYRTDLVGPIVCEASNALTRNRSEAFSLVVHYGPERVTISPEAPPAYLASQMDFNLTCSSVSSPEATYKWFLGETKVKEGPLLTLKDIEKEGLGKTKSSYICNATNAKTAMTVSSPPVTFTILDVIDGLKLSAPVGKLFAGNSSANLSCSVTAGSMPMVKWVKNGAALSTSGRVVISADMMSVLIQPLQKEDNGEYSCQISNPVSKQEDKVKLTVFYGPEPVVLTGDSEVEVTDPVKLECSASSMPPANYSWKFNNSKTAVTTNVYIIDKAAYTNTGTYTCEATNVETGKTSSKSIFLAVKEEGALDEGLSDGAIAGIVIGVLAAIGVAIGLFLYCRQKVPLESPY